MTSFAAGAGFVLGTMALALAVYFGARLIAAPRMGEDTKDLAGSVVFRVASMHGLILALVFAQELEGYQQLRSSLIDEATAAADIYYDIARYGSEHEATVHAAVSDYVRAVAGEEWRLLDAEEGLSSEAWRHRETIYLALLDLEPRTPRQEALREHMLTDVQMIAAVRQQRDNIHHSIHPLFWFAAVAGLVLVALPYFVFRPAPVNIMLLSVYGAYTGLVMFLIYALSDPFSPPGLLRPAALELLLVDIVAGP